MQESLAELSIWPTDKYLGVNPEKNSIHKEVKNGNVLVTSTQRGRAKTVEGS